MAPEANSVPLLGRVAMKRERWGEWRRGRGLEPQVLCVRDSQQLQLSSELVAFTKRLIQLPPQLVAFTKRLVQWAPQLVAFTKRLFSSFAGTRSSAAGLVLKLFQRLRTLSIACRSLAIAAGPHLSSALNLPGQAPIPSRRCNFRPVWPCLSRPTQWQLRLIAQADLIAF
jgi:hypothetical protein